LREVTLVRSYRVLLEGRPVLLTDAETQEILRLGFFTTRWVRADSPDAACRKARELVVQALEAKGTKNPPDEPTVITVSEVVEVGWLERLRRASGIGFLFFPEEPD
jgi:hypothetical protein